MKERLITLGTALAALALLVLFLAPPKSGQAPVSLPTSEDRGVNGLKGLYAWLQREQIPVQSWRLPFRQLPNASGNLLIVTLPTPQAIPETEWRSLSAWVARGNHLLILGAAYRQADWIKAADCFCDVRKFLAGFHWSLSQAEAEPAQAAENPQPGDSLKQKLESLQAQLQQQQPQDSRLQADSAAAPLQGVQGVASQTTPRLLSKPWTLAAAAPNKLGQKLLHIQLETGGPPLPAAWRLNAGDGGVSLFLTADLFSNKRLAQADNALFFSQLLEQTLAADGRVLFDDYHFGLSDLYDPQHFFKDPRLHQTLAALGLFWLCYLIGYSNRLAPARNAAAKLSARDYIQASAGFFARRLGRRQLAQALAQHLLGEIRRRRRLPSDAEVWLWLENHARIAAPQLALLKQAHGRQNVSLMELSTVLTQIRAVAL